MTAAFAVVFAFGVGLGEVTSSDVKPGAAQTRVRTVVPIAATRETVTITTTVTTAP
jgi:hypothetical protein